MNKRRLEAIAFWCIWRSHCEKSFQAVQIKPETTIIKSLNFWNKQSRNPLHIYTTDNQQQPNYEPGMLKIQMKTRTAIIYCIYQAHPRFSLVMVIFANEEDSIEDCKVFTCRVSTHQEGNTLGLLEALKWKQQHKERHCKIQMDDKKLMKEVKKKWNNTQYQSNNKIVDHYVDYISYFRKFEFNSLR